LNYNTVYSDEVMGRQAMRVLRLFLGVDKYEAEVDGLGGKKSVALG